MRKKGIFAGALTLGLMMFIHQPIHAHAADAVFIDENSFPDEYFRQYVAENYDLDGDGYLDEEECGKVESLVFNSDPISTFAGIEFFPNLNSFQCYNCGTSELDVSKNPALTWINCEYCNLKSLDMSHNPALEYLYCSNNQLTELDVSNCPLLTGLGCSYNQLTELDVSNCPQMTEIWCYVNQLTKLTIGDKPELTILECGSNQLQELDISLCPKLDQLGCDTNQIQELNVRNNPVLRILDYAENKGLVPDVNTNSSISSLSCNGNDLTELDLSNYPKLSYLDCYKNSLTELDFSNNPALTWINCSYNKLTELDVSMCSKLSHIDCGNNTKIDVLDLRNSSSISWSVGCVGTFIIKTDDDLGWNNRYKSTYYYVVDDGTTPKKSHLAAGTMVIDGKTYEFDETYNWLLTDITVPTEISASPDSVTLTRWDTATLTATTSPEVTEEGELVWKSEDESIVTVDQNGVITPVSEGTTSITVASVYDRSIMHVVPVTVKPLLTFESEELQLVAGETGLGSYVMNTKGIKSITFTSLDTSIAGITKDSMITGNDEGETDVVVTVTGEDGETETMTIHVVVSADESINTDVERIVLYYQGEEISEDEDLSVMVGDLCDFTAKVYVKGEEEGYDYSFDNSVITTSHGRIRLAWSSSNPRIASVNKGATDIGAAGIVYISAQAVGTMIVSEAATISSKAPPIRLRSVSIVNADPIEIGESQYLKPIFTPMNADNKSVRWESSDPSIVEVNEFGKITGISVGTAEISVISTEDSSITAMVRIEVKPGSVKSIQLRLGTAEASGDGLLFVERQTIEEGSGITFMHKYDTEFYLCSSVNEDAADKSLEYMLDDPASTGIALEDVTSEFTGLSGADRVFRVTAVDLGEAMLTLTATANDFSRSISVRVLPYDEWVKVDAGYTHYTKDKMDTGWKQIDKKWYCFSAKGIMKTGWLKSGSGSNVRWDFLGANGAMVTGWKKIGSKWYFFGTDGIMQTGWKKSGGKWYLLGADGMMQTGWKKSGGKWYFFGADGIMRTGWQKIGNKWYFFKSGAMYAGWLRSGGKWYYFNASSGAMTTGSVKIGSKIYNFGSSGVCLNP